MCHSLAVFSRYLVCDADDAPRRRCRAPGGFSYSALALPNLGQGLATVVAHGLIGAALGLYAWNFVPARAGVVGMKLKRESVSGGRGRAQRSGKRRGGVKYMFGFAS